MQRFTYRAWVKRGEENTVERICREIPGNLVDLFNNGFILSTRMFRWGNNLFVYYECTGRQYMPEELFPAMGCFLEDWPGEAQEGKWIRMMDIYHCVEPVSAEHWRRKEPVRSVSAKLMRLKPEMLSSYIFYHWQYQEEKPGDWCKYCSIYLHENLTIMFTEEPDPPEVPPYKGKLDTSNTPGNWAELMYSHCIPWDDVSDENQKMWRGTELLWHLG